jgi:hypothetical protein
VGGPSRLLPDMKIGFISSTPRFSQLRHSRLIESLKSFGVHAEFYTPFEDYTHVVVESGALVEPLVPVLEKYKERGTKIVLHLTETTCPRGLHCSTLSCVSTSRFWLLSSFGTVSSERLRRFRLKMASPITPEEVSQNDQKACLVRELRRRGQPFYDSAVLDGSYRQKYDPYGIG